MRTLILIATHCFWFPVIARILTQACSFGVIDASQRAALIRCFDPTQVHDCY